MHPNDGPLQKDDGTAQEFIEKDSPPPIPPVYLAEDFNDEKRYSPTKPVYAGDDAESGDTLPTEEDNVWTFESMVDKIVPKDEDPDAPTVTFRSILVGIVLSVFGSTLAQIYYFKGQVMSISPFLLTTIAYLMGIGLQRLLPESRFWNPGKFNMKEHALIMVMAGSASASALGTELIGVMDLYYNQPMGWVSSMGLLLATQLMGYGFAGLMRKALVYPKGMYYPGTLPKISLIDALHRDKSAATSNRIKVFVLVFVGIFVWEWFPSWVFPLLAGISIACLAAPDSLFVTRLFGGASANEGLGLLSVSLDWNCIAIFNPLYYPLGTQLNMYIGVGICYVLLISSYELNLWNTQVIPSFLSADLFTQSGEQYDQTQILGDHFKVDPAKLNEYGLPMYTATTALYILGSNLGITASLVHMVLWHGKEIWSSFTSGKGSDDHHMAQVKDRSGEVPMWWYLALLALSLGTGFGLIFTLDIGFTWWAYLLSCFLGFALTLLCGVFLGATGFQMMMQGIIQMIGGYVAPGNPVANMWFTLFGYNATNQSVALLSDLKFSAYMSVGFRETFAFQIVGTLVGALCNYLIQLQLITAKREILLDPRGDNQWSGQNFQSFNAAAVTWGGLTKYLFSPGQMYFPLVYVFFIGLFIPIPFWLLHKKWPKAGWNLINTGIIAWFIGNLSIGINSGTTSQLAVAFITQYYIRKYHSEWFTRYNYMIASGLDAGAQIATLVISFAVLGGSGTPVPFPTWWGNPEGNVDRCMLEPK